MSLALTHMGVLLFGIGIASIWSNSKTEDAHFVAALLGGTLFVIGAFVFIVTKGAT